MKASEVYALGYQSPKFTAARGWCGVLRQMFTAGLFVGIKKDGHGGRFCYETVAEASDALANWDGVGDPPGRWLKAKLVGEEDRRGPGLTV